jgi:uncharacterized protein YfaP (DUF2135 family)
MYDQEDPMKPANLLVVSFAAVAAAAALWLAVPAGGEDEGPSVRILSPRGGWSQERIVTISGTARGEGVARAVIVINGAEKEVLLADGRFEVTEVFPPGRNTVKALAEDAQGRVGRDCVTFYTKAPERDLKVSINWDTGGTDMDLHVVDPKGEVCMYNHRQTALGGSLDVDVTTGWGPETFTLANAVPGTYKVYVHYYGPGEGPVTVVTAWIVMYEGTPKERREKKTAILVQQNEKPLLFEFKVE